PPPQSLRVPILCPPPPETSLQGIIECQVPIKPNPSNARPIITNNSPIPRLCAINTFSPSAGSNSHPRAQTQTSAHPHQARNRLSSFSASSYHHGQENQAYSARRAIHPA